ncbi:unnamed protein product [Caenorhabditis brenneri]
MKIYFVVSIILCILFGIVAARYSPPHIRKYCTDKPGCYILDEFNWKCRCYCIKSDSMFSPVVSTSCSDFLF